jgi:hypothetical protein
MNRREVEVEAVVAVEMDVVPPCLAGLAPPATEDELSYVEMTFTVGVVPGYEGRLSGRPEDCYEAQGSEPTTVKLTKLVAGNQPTKFTQEQAKAIADHFYDMAADVACEEVDDHPNRYSGYDDYEPPEGAHYWEA